MSSHLIKKSNTSKFNTFVCRQTPAMRHDHLLMCQLASPGMSKSRDGRKTELGRRQAASSEQCQPHFS